MCICKDGCDHGTVVLHEVGSCAGNVKSRIEIYIFG